MERPGTSSGYLYVTLAAALWGTFGIFVKLLNAYQVPPLVIATGRAGLGFSFTLIILLAKMRHDLKVPWRDLPWLILYGVLSMGLFSTLYIYTISVSSMAFAVFLLYTAPIFVLIMARFALGEAIGPTKVTALISCVIGLVLLLGVYKPGGSPVAALTVLAGLGSGFTFALFSVLGKALLRKHSQWTLTAYMLGSATLVLSLIAGRETARMPFSPGLWLPMVGMALIPTTAAYALFYSGLKRIEAGRASILATIEPLIATLAGLALFGERVGLPQGLGGGLILLGAVLAQARK